MELRILRCFLAIVRGEQDPCRAAAAYQPTLSGQVKELKSERR